jgi:outer membrane protein assembly factor BamB
MLEFRSWTALSFALVLGSSIHAIADDWPQWRGPNRDGISKETGLLKTWPSGGPKLLWTANGLGEGFSTPSVVGNTLLTMGNRDGQEFVIAVDVVDAGKQLWATPIGPVRHGGSGYPGPRSTPTVDGDRVYALGLNGDLVCLELKTGKFIWRHDLVGEFGGTIPSWGYSESVLVDGPWVVCTPGGAKASIAALLTTTGEPVWSSPIGAAAAYASIVKGDLAGIKQYVQFMDPGVFGIAAKDGEPLWRYDQPSNGTANIPTPLVSGDVVFAASGYGTGGGAARIAKRDGTFIANEKFFTHDMVNQHGGMILVDGHIYGSSDPGKLCCIELASGETKWQERAPGKCSLIYVDGQLISRSERSKVCLINATPQGCEVVGEFDEPNPSDKPSWPHPVVANGRLYLRDQDAVSCYELKK